MGGPALAFIGLGEAATAIATGLGETGLEGITAFDRDQDDPARREVIAARTAQSGVTLASSLDDLIKPSDIVISSVTSDVATTVAEAAAAHLGEQHIYVDINSTSPEVKIGIGRTIEPTGARFVEAAVMAAVPPFKQKVPMLLCGAAASQVIAALAPYGMDLEDFGPELGRAAATKMFRSIVVKGLEALLQECVLGADRYGVADRVLDSVETGYPGIDWKKLASYLMGRTAIHGERRAHEMEEVAATLKSLNIDPLMAEAAGRRIAWCGSLGLKEVFGEQVPDSYKDVLKAINAKLERS